MTLLCLKATDVSASQGCGDQCHWTLQSSSTYRLDCLHASTSTCHRFFVWNTYRFVAAVPLARPAAHLSITVDFKLTCVCDFAGATLWSGVWRASVKEGGKKGADKSIRRTDHDKDHSSNEHIQRPCLLKMYIGEVSFSTNTFIALTFLFLLNCYGLLVKSFSLHVLISVQSCMPDF